MIPRTARPRRTALPRCPWLPAAPRAAWDIAVAEDDPAAGTRLGSLLKRAGYRVVLYSKPSDFLSALVRSRFSAAFIELRLPGMDGKDVIRVLRANEESRRMILIAVSLKAGCHPAPVDAFNAGADEYFPAPADPELVLVRLKSLLRRRLASPRREEPLTLGELTVLPDERECRLSGRADKEHGSTARSPASSSARGRSLRLTRLEFDLLVYFLRQRNRILTRGNMLKALWRADPPTGTGIVDKHVENLRRKLGAFGGRIETVIKLGYVLKG
ncbi:MAG: response regulator transcription factor [Elusimicrobia bacterium]|nr:response regulator transcription factor [Elusimicrobiota bacterium]